MLTPVIQTVRSDKTPWEVYQNLRACSEVAFFLDSICSRPPDQRYSYLMARPFLELTVPAPGRYGTPMLSVTGEKRLKAPAGRLFKVLRRLMGEYPVRPDPHIPFFRGGVAGYWGYDLVSFFEKLRLREKPDSGLAWCYLGFFRDLIVYDHAKAVYHLVVLTQNPAGKRSGNEKRFDALKEFLRKASGKPQGFALRGFRPEITRCRFETMVRRAKEYIAAGDIYQANLSQRFSFRFRGSGIALYDRLRRINPSPFSSYLKIRDLEIISCSPERLVKKTGRDCQTRPIAGTYPRPRLRSQDKTLARGLVRNPKERAEHVMLVDLERNDLGRVCDWRTVKVEEMMTVEKYSHVIHIVSKIVGRLRRGQDALDLVRAMFPGGTITGCPKIRCMEIIRELEPVRRGIYTGSIGYLDFCGDLDLNIVIRTLVLKGRRGYLQVGAGIVHDSDPSREFEETLHKGKALVQALAEASRRSSAKKGRRP